MSRISCLLSTVALLSFLALQDGAHATDSPSSPDSPAAAPAPSGGLLELPFAPANATPPSAPASPASSPPVVGTPNSPAPGTSSVPAASLKLPAASGTPGEKPPQALPAAQQALPPLPGAAMPKPLPQPGPPGIPAGILPPSALSPARLPPSATLPAAAGQPGVNMPMTLSDSIINPLTPGKPAPDPIAENPDLILVPTSAGSTSILFSKRDLDVLKGFLAMYDNPASIQKVEAPAEKKDDLLSLLGDIKQPGEKQEAAPLPLPNIYLGSIVYYSPSQWSVWINGKKIVNRFNAQTNEYFVRRIANGEVEIVWRPASLLDTPGLWKQLTNNGKDPLPNIEVDEAQGQITLRLRPNQTFLPRSLLIREGLIRPSNDVSVPDTAHKPPSH